MEDLKHTFIFNAIENGWTVYKKGNKYIFVCKHNNSKEVYSDTYLKKFISTNLEVR